MARHYLPQAGCHQLPEGGAAEYVQQEVNGGVCVVETLENLLQGDEALSLLDGVLGRGPRLVVQQNVQLDDVPVGREASVGVREGGMLGRPSLGVFPRL